MDDNIKSKLAINIAQLSLEKATLEAQCESLQGTINELASTNEAQANQIQELERENAELKEQKERFEKDLDDLQVEEVKQ